MNMMLCFLLKKKLKIKKKPLTQYLRSNILLVALYNNYKLPKKIVCFNYFKRTDRQIDLLFFTHSCFFLLEPETLKMKFYRNNIIKLVKKRLHKITIDITFIFIHSFKINYNLDSTNTKRMPNRFSIFPCNFINIIHLL